MPELPEVETVKNELTPHVVGRCITGITLSWDGIIRQTSAEEFRSRLIGRKITAITRRGKYLIFSLNNDDIFVIHLRMTGSLLVKPAAAEPEKFIRAIICLDSGISIHFRDPRKFGRMWLVDKIESIVEKLGPEPLEDSFTPELLAQLLANRKAPIKALLLDQDLIAGIGNMYADEALFACGIHPLRTGASLSKEEIVRLHKAIRDVLRAGIVNKGASVDTYFRPSGEEGTAHSHFKVAHRISGNLCPTCGTNIERTTVRNRGTYFCPKCQPNEVII
ncbi:bifunctional DNA-formamidopyrimidine glycosylase/DNA-(apurinic or apyrimidinic site) lyase [Chloroflexota bacterium]